MSKFKILIPLTLLCLGYAFAFFLYYPLIAGVEDEVGFLNQSLVWSHGALSAEGAGYTHGLQDFIEVNGAHVPARHPGRSLIALPFLILGGVKATFVSGLLLQLLAAVGAAMTLSRLGRSPLWAVLVLFHPTLAIYSRTIMADGAAGTALLYAGLGLISGQPVLAGISVGLAAVMRYHSALALPLVAALFLFQPDLPRPKARRSALLCLAAGAAVGCLLCGYNMVVYGMLTEPFTSKRGTFGLQYLLPNLGFYSLALLVVWPGMLLVPMLDRSPLRWLLRGMILIFVGPILFYYFHDIGPGWLETCVVGQRLIQVVLPVWVVCYAGVLEERVVVPVRQRLGQPTWNVLVSLLCLVLLASTLLVFSRHQRQLKLLAQAQADIVANVPSGSLILTQGAIRKLVGVPEGIPEYELRLFDYQGSPATDPVKLYQNLDHRLFDKGQEWFLAILTKYDSQNVQLPAHTGELIEHYHLTRLPVNSRLLQLYKATPPARATN